VSAMSGTGAWTFSDGRPGRFGVLFAAVWLVFLANTFQKAWSAAWSDRHSPAGWAGLVALVAFVVCYLAAFTWIRTRRQRLQMVVPARTATLVLTVLLGLTAVTSVAVGQSGTAGLVYVVVVGVMTLPTRGALALAVVLALANEVSARVVPGWSEQAGLTFAICTAAFATWGVQQLMLRNVDLLRAREENARLAVADERNRFARDLHDILGHSLTVITVKAELANRLLDVDADRARTELADLERLSRDALVDVRRAVDGYREITLPGELARAREALRAADIKAQVPYAAEEVPSHLRDLFAWVVREGVTNVIRHSCAAHCAVTLAPDAVTVRDDGTGSAAGTPVGHGLAGLRERAAVAGAVVVTRTLEPHGFLLEVSAR
jgi:two-component system sensor histidine kinase DesK